MTFSYMYAMYFEHTCSQLPSLIPPHSHLSPSSFRLIPLVFWMTRGVALGLLLGAWVRAVCRVLLLHSHHPLTESESSGHGGRALRAPCTPWQAAAWPNLLKLLRRWSQLSRVQSCCCCLFPCGQPSTLFRWLLNSLWPFLRASPRISVGSMWCRCQFTAEHLIVLYSHHSRQWRPSVLTASPSRGHFFEQSW